jgi:Na+-translocating ferredoxin:NAD+ oxidoreductase subunit C
MSIVARTGFPRGGVHPEEQKKLSSGSDPVVVMPPKKVAVAVTQHLGKPSRLIVRKGEEVVVGQILAEADGPISANLHSPVSGKIIKIADAEVVGAYRSPVINIMNNGEDQGLEEFNVKQPICWADKELFMERIRTAGIVGLGGATFPTAIKLRPPPGVKVDTLLLNGCECEPYLTADDVLMRTRSAEMIAGGMVMAAVLGVNSIMIGVEVNKPEAIAALRKVVDEKSADALFDSAGPAIRIEVVGLKTRYPQGAEKQLIDALMTRQVPSGQLPFAVGAVVQNVGTALAAYEAVAFGKPLIERVVTLTGRAIKRPGNYLARIGTPLSVLVEAADGTTDDLAAMIAGGPMMGKSIRTLEVPVVKGLSGVLFLTADEVSGSTESDCIRCGRCVDACPMGLAPCDITAQAEYLNWERAVGLGALDCVECGSCQYACPASRFLVSRLRLTKYYWRRLKK